MFDRVGSLACRVWLYNTLWQLVNIPEFYIKCGKINSGETGNISNIMMYLIKH